MGKVVYVIFSILILLFLAGAFVYRVGVNRCKETVYETQQTQIREKEQTQKQIQQRVLSISDRDNFDFLLTSYLRAD